MSVNKEWPLSFISEENFIKHVTNTIEKYGSKLESINLTKFNSNIIDPVKLLFDKNVYNQTWDTIIKNEIYRQRDKSNNNEIGYFHQIIFSYIDGCNVPNNGWDVIYKNKNGIELPCEKTVHTVYVEMKNKHNTMNSSSSGKTFIRMQDRLLQESDCACFLVEAIAKRSQNITWAPSVDGKVISHNCIRRVSIDKFYAIVTGIDDAFYQMCMVLPQVIKNVVASSPLVKIPVDTVTSEIRSKAKSLKLDDEDMSMMMAFYLLGFGTYSGFKNCITNII